MADKLNGCQVNGLGAGCSLARGSAVHQQSFSSALLHNLVHNTFFQERSLMLTKELRHDKVLQFSFAAAFF